MFTIRESAIFVTTKFLRTMTKNNLLSEQLNYNGDSQTPTHLHLCSYNTAQVEKSRIENDEEDWPPSSWSP